MQNNDKTLAAKYRPTTFEEVCGQSITVKILNNVVNKRKYKNAYLFAGDSGCGKTTLARIFASYINNGEGDPIEKDAASNGGVDEVRAIVENASTRAIIGQYKIYIIDECHAITGAGWQAFLKCIEEAPTYTIFIFCTTEPNKIPQTILNRVQRYNISKVNVEDIKKRLMYICEQEHFTNYEQACELISKTSNGCMRDAITTLDRCSDLSTDLSLTNVKAVLGGLSFENMFKLTWSLKKDAGNNKQIGDILNIVDGLAASGVDMKYFIDLYMSFILDLEKFAMFGDIALTGIPAHLATADNGVVQYTNELIGDNKWYINLIDTLLELKLQTKYDSSYISTIKAFLIRFYRGQ